MGERRFKRIQSVLGKRSITDQLNQRKSQIYLHIGTEFSEAGSIVLTLQHHNETQMVIKIDLEGKVLCNTCTERIIQHCYTTYFPTGVLWKDHERKKKTTIFRLFTSTLNIHTFHGSVQHMGTPWPFRNCLEDSSNIRILKNLEKYRYIPIQGISMLKKFTPCFNASSFITTYFFSQSLTNLLQHRSNHLFMSKAKTLIRHMNH